jgi:hypothetical protein
MSEFHDKAKATPENGWSLPDDGTTYWVSTADLSPDDTFDGAYPAGDSEAR